MGSYLCFKTFIMRVYITFYKEKKLIHGSHMHRLLKNKSTSRPFPGYFYAAYIFTFLCFPWIICKMNENYTDLTCLLDINVLT